MKKDQMLKELKKLQKRNNADLSRTDKIKTSKKWNYQQVRSELSRARNIDKMKKRQRFFESNTRVIDMKKEELVKEINEKSKVLNRIINKEVKKGNVNTPAMRAFFDERQGMKFGIKGKNTVAQLRSELRSIRRYGSMETIDTYGSKLNKNQSLRTLSRVAGKEIREGDIDENKIWEIYNKYKQSLENGSGYFSRLDSDRIISVIMKKDSKNPNRSIEDILDEVLKYHRTEEERMEEEFYKIEEEIKNDAIDKGFFPWK